MLLSFFEHPDRLPMQKKLNLLVLARYHDTHCNIKGESRQEVYTALRLAARLADCASRVKCGSGEAGETVKCQSRRRN